MSLLHAQGTPCCARKEQACVQGTDAQARYYLGDLWRLRGYSVRHFLDLLVFVSRGLWEDQAARGCTYLWTQDHMGT